MAKLFDARQDRPLGTVTDADIALLAKTLGIGPGARHKVDNDTFLALVDAGAHATLLDAVKSVIDVEGEGELRWETA